MIEVQELTKTYGPVTAVDQALDTAAAEIRVWVEETRQARTAGLDLDHAAVMVAERTRQRYRVLGEDGSAEIAAKYDRISSTAANVAGIMRWLDKGEAS